MPAKIIIAQMDRLILRRFCEEDLQDLYAYLSDEEVVKFEPYRAMDMGQVQQELSRKTSTEEMIAVELKESGNLIGNLYLGKRAFNTRELGYVFNKAYWGQGYARESCEAILDKAFQEGVHRIYAECDPDNAASWGLLERLGFAREACFRKNVYFWKDDQGEPIWKDTFVYARLKTSEN